MIIKEEYKTREDDTVLYRTYSDTDHKIRKVSTGEVYDSAIDVTDAEFDYEEIDSYVDFEGASSLDEVVNLQEQINKTTRKINHIGLTNKEALSVKEFYPRWENFIGKTLEFGFVVLHVDRLWRVRQTHIAQSDWAPSANIASLWEIVEVEHEGTEADPIPYAIPMEIFEGKYYIEDNQLYFCTRSSGIALSHSLSTLVGLYVECV